MTMQGFLLMIINMIIISGSVIDLVCFSSRRVAQMKAVVEL